MGDPTRAVSEHLIGLLQCPTCKSHDLAVGADALTCNACSSRFSCHRGVPDFVGTEETYEGFEYQWKLREKGRFESQTLYGKTLQDELDQFFRHLRADPDSIAGLTVLDAGCGSGRMIAALASGHDTRCVGLDMSSTVFGLRAAVPHANLELVRGNILHPPFRPAGFDLVWSGGVIHHTGDTEQAFANLARLVKPGGSLYVWVYSVNQGVFGKVRKLVPGAWRLPHRLLYGLCMGLAVPIYLGGALTGRYHPFREVLMKLFDHLNPRYRTVHSDPEVVTWFERAGFEDVEVVISQQTGGVGVCGRRGLDS